MTKVNLNAVFYSKGNLERAYQIKNMCWHTNYEVVNISDFSELVYCIHKQQINLLIIDGETIHITEELLEVVKGGKLAAPDNIFFVDCDVSINFDVNNENMFFVSYSDLNDALFNNQQKIEFNIEKNKSIQYDSNFINTYLTQYLIRLGFLPKHMGFYYIKQCIEEALTHNGVLGSLNSDIYPSVARRNATTAVNVERNIRHSIEHANKFSGENEMVLKNVCNTEKHVSNRAFLAFLLDQVIICHKQMKENYTAFYS